MIITIDGPAASGKGTLAKLLACHFGLPHLDTGVLYRVVALDLLEAGRGMDDAVMAAELARRVEPSSYDDADLRAPHVGELASVVSAIPQVRSALLDFQVRFANRAEGAVLDGRDCGTVIAPHAEAKFFVTALPEVRADRRASELARRGAAVDPAEVLADIRRRDDRDSNRSAAPLMIAPGAIVIDTTLLSVDEMLSAALMSIGQSHPVLA